jgi:histidinol-phosphate aminotransferase
MGRGAPASLRQGGDLRGLSPDRRYLDLSTCVNCYGPPPAVQLALRSFDPKSLLAHPYEAEALFTATYAGYLGVDAVDLIPGRGITEFIWMLADVLPPDQVAVVTPDYTDIIKAFPLHLPPVGPGRDTARSRLERIERGLRQYSYVFISNPNNPLGLLVHRDDLVDVCAAHPASTLIVDESYIDFTPEPQLSMLGTGLPNLVVLRSPTKLFGMAGTRTGVLWTLDRGLSGRVRERKLTWALSQIDAVLASHALRAVEWVTTTRCRLLQNASAMERLLVERFGEDVVTDVPVHYRFVSTERPECVHEQLLEQGVVVRIFAGTDPGRLPGFRITTPLDHELGWLAESLGTRNRQVHAV